MSSGSIYASLTIVNLKVLSDTVVDSWLDDSTCMKFLFGKGGGEGSGFKSLRGRLHTHTHIHLNYFLE